MNKSKIESIVNSIAMDCFSSYDILRDGVLFELSEIEIYLKIESKGINDIFRHEHLEQGKGKGKGKDKHLRKDSKSIHYSGFDICMGDESKDNEVYCGALVRGLMSKDSPAGDTYGPGRVAYTYPGKGNRIIEIIKRNDKSNNLRFYDDTVDPYQINSDIILRMPRVNLSKSTCSDHLNNPAELDKYLNLKARFLRVRSIKSMLSKNGPEELREVFNSLLSR